MSLEEQALPSVPSPTIWHLPETQIKRANGSQKLLPVSVQGSPARAPTAKGLQLVSSKQVVPSTHRSSWLVQGAPAAMGARQVPVLVPALGEHQSPAAQGTIVVSGGTAGAQAWPSLAGVAMVT
jgi:hypothetical protein